MASKVDIHGNIAHSGSTHITNVNIAPATTIEEINRACLQALQCPDCFAMKTRLKEKERLLSELVEWVLEESAYRTWLNDDNTQLLWIKGGPGKGKTMLSIFFIEHLSNPKNETTATTIYFFFRRDDKQLNSIIAILKGLILGLINHHQELVESLISRWDTQKKCFTVEVSSWRVLWDIFLEMIEHCRAKRVYIIVDALDECHDDALAKFLQLVVRTALTFVPKMKWMFMSRPLTSASVEFGSLDKAMLNLELTTDPVTEAIRVYIATRVKELDLRKNYGSALCQDLRQSLASKAEKTFLWVSLVCKELEHIDKVDVSVFIQKTPAGLESYYRYMADLLLKQDQPDVVPHCMRLLKTMWLVYRPLAITEICSATGLPNDDSYIERLIELCGSFIRKQDSNVEFVHFSTNEFFDSEYGQSILNFHENYGHEDVAITCLSYLTEHLRPNPVQERHLGWKHYSKHNSETIQTTLSRADVAYAATFWLDHMKSASDPDGPWLDRGEVTTPIVIEVSQPCLRALDKFLRSRLLEWLEYLSWLERLLLAQRAFRMLDAITQGTSLQPLVNDISFFFSSQYTTIYWKPLQLYISALANTSESSLVRQIYSDRIPKWLSRRPKPPLHYKISTCRTYRGRDSRIVPAISPDGNLVALVESDNRSEEEREVSLIPYLQTKSNDNSIISSSHKSRIIVFHPSTDVIHHAFSESQEMKAISFSPDGQKIASILSAGFLKIWDIRSSRYVEICCNTDMSSISNIAFSSDSKRIAIAVQNVVYLWDATTGILYRTLSLPENVSSLAFFADSEQIVLLSFSHIARLWDIELNIHKTTLQLEHSEGCVISPDGTRIATLTDHSIRVWDTRSGHKLETITLLKEVSREIPLVFSCDNRFLAMAYCGPFLWNNKTISVLELDSGVTYPIQNEFLYNKDQAIAFSADGRRLMVSSKDVALRDIMMWDIEKLTTLNSLAREYKAKGQISDGSEDTETYDDSRLDESYSGVLSIVFSPDGKFVVLVFLNAIKVWDAYTQDFLRELARPPETPLARYYFKPVAFFPDSQHIFEFHYREKIAICNDITTGAIQKILPKWGPRSVPWRLEDDTRFPMAISPDGKMVAIDFSDGAIRLIGIHSGRTIKYLASPKDGSTFLAFSPDGSMIASSSFSTISLYDLKKGSSIISNIYLPIPSVKQFSTRTPVLSLRFSKDSKLFLTNFAPIEIPAKYRKADARTGSSNQSHGLLSELSADNDWIYYGDNAIVINHHEEFMSSWGASENKLWIGTEDGRILRYEIDRELLQKCLDEGKQLGY